MSKLSEAEAELYDRQIRLWGIESQEKLRAANVLLLGVRGLGSEIAKNILLSGINSLTILDDGVVTEKELLNNFLLDRKSVGSKIAEAIVIKAQALNPLVKITADTHSVGSKESDFFKGFTIVIGTNLNVEKILFISRICRKHKVKFICGDVFGMFGYSVADFQKHEYYEDQVVLGKAGKKRTHDGKAIKYIERQTVRVQNSATYPTLDKVLILPKEKPATKKRNPFYFLMLVLLEFRNKHKRDPSAEHRVEDVKTLKAIKAKVLDSYNVDHSKLKEEALDLVFGEVVPVCSITGGVIAQEVIKAVSHKEVPINNVFLLDPFSYAGREESITN